MKDAAGTRIRLASGQGRVKSLYKPPSSHPEIDNSILYSFFTCFIKYTLLYPARAKRPSHGAQVGSETVVASLLWAPSGDSFGLVFGLSGDLGASSALLISSKTFAL